MGRREVIFCPFLFYQKVTLSPNTGCIVTSDIERSGQLMRSSQFFEMKAVPDVTAETICPPKFVLWPKFVRLP